MTTEKRKIYSVSIDPAHKRLLDAIEFMIDSNPEQGSPLGDMLAAVTIAVAAYEKVLYGPF